MDFFQHQDNARRRTGWLVLWLVLAVSGIIVSVYVVIGVALALASERVPSPAELVDPRSAVFPWVVGVTVAGVIGSMWWKRMTMGAGGARLLASLGLRELDDRAEAGGRVLRNVVEEMSIASGVPAPRVLVMPGESAINGFVCGTTSADATLVVTQGALDKLTRDELQALVAHEYSHLFHGDTRLNLRLIAVLHGILFIALCGRGLLEGLRHARIRTSNRKDDNGGGVLLFILGLGLALWALGSIGSFFARLIKLAINRQREFLADAAAVQFTRNPDAMVGLLAKIAGGKAGGVLQSARAMEFSHFFFADITRHRFSAALATHPPLEERIRRIQPDWQASADGVASPAASPARAAHRTVPLAEETGVVALAEVQAAPARVAEVVGQAEQAHLGRVWETLERIPRAVRGAAEDPLGAQAVVLLLLTLDNRLDPAAVGLVLDGAEPGLERELRTLWVERGAIHPAARLAMLDLCLPALRRMTPAQHARFRRTVEAVCGLDPSTTLFETLLHHLLTRHLDANYRRRPLRLVRHYRLAEVQAPAARLLSALAGAVSADEVAAARAYAAAVAADAKTAGWKYDGLPEAERMEAIIAGLSALARASFEIRRLALVAVTAVVLHDRAVSAEEAEWLRLIADALECPIPPWLSVAST